MARKQLEIDGTESPARDPELHALGLELYDLQNQRMDLTKAEKAKREEIAALMKTKRMKEYHVDGVLLWIEPGAPKVKVRMDKDDDDSDAEPAE